MPQQINICLSIAGSDPSGGAGIQADLKTFTTLKVYGCAAITCLTAQNSFGVQSVFPVDPDNLRSQIQLVLEDQPVSHIKIGMVGNVKAAMVIAGTLSGFRGPIIWDPVFKASDGSSLAESQSLSSIRRHMLDTATAITPNKEEFELLTDQPFISLDQAIQSAQTLFVRHRQLKMVLLTGGHLPVDQSDNNLLLTDVLMLNPEKFSGPLVERRQHEKISSQNTHGTGCTFSSAFTANLAKGNGPKEAFFKTVDFVDQIVRKSAFCKTGQAHGGMVHHLYSPDD